jgi:hypothetical protein
MKALFYWIVLGPLCLLAFVFLLPLAHIAMNLAGVIAAFAMESITVGAIHFASHFVPEEKAARM